MINHDLLLCVNKKVKPTKWMSEFGHKDSALGEKKWTIPELAST